MNSSSTEMFKGYELVLHRAKFLILISLQIPAIVITLFIFAFFITHRTQLNNLQTQALIFILVVNFLTLSVDLPMPIHFYRLGYVSPATAAYCTWWTFFEYSFNLASELLMATISIQRHILIFQAHLLHMRLKRYILYYLPLLLCLIYPIIFYMIAIVIYPCDGTQWDFTANVCGNANCYLLYDVVLGTYDWVMNVGLPTIIIILANVTLVIRVINQKHRRQQHISWKKQRRMTLQLLSISSLYLVAWLPSVIIGAIQELGPSNFLSRIQSDYTLNLIYFVSVFLPWVYLALLPEFTKWIWKYLYRGEIARNTVRPI